VAAGGNPGRPVHVDTHVALLGHMRRAGMDAHAQPDRSCGQSLQPRGRRLERTWGGREGDEEGVSLRIDLDAAVAVEGLAEGPSVLGERLGVALGTELSQQLRRALHVGKEEGDGSGRKTAPHGQNDATQMVHTWQ
jgi:hypothetical protein